MSIKNIVRCIRDNTINIKEYEGKQIYVIENLLTKTHIKEFINLINKLPLNDELIKPNGSNVQGYMNVLQNNMLLDDSKYYKYDIGLKKIEITNKLNGLMHNDIIMQINNLNQIFIDVYKIINDINQNINVEFNSNYILRIITGATRLHKDDIIIDKSFNLNKIMKFGEQINFNMNTEIHRRLSTIIALNSDYDGGELVFPEQNVSIKLKEGDIICFPPYWTHPHRSNELLNNTKRYTITCWHGNKVV